MADTDMQVGEDPSSFAAVDGALVLPGKTYKGGRAELPSAFLGASELKKTDSPKRVLVVEDNLDSVHTLVYLLAEMGHIVEYAINGYVAVDTAKRFRPNFVLLDLGLPGIDGFAVCRQIKRDPNLRSCRVIALTAFGHQEYRDRAANAGCELYLLKPVPAKVLEELLG
jgi:CheY-like chemotaxis protein